MQRSFLTNETRSEWNKSHRQLEPSDRFDESSVRPSVAGQICVCVKPPAQGCCLLMCWPQLGLYDLTPGLVSPASSYRLVLLYTGLGPVTDGQPAVQSKRLASKGIHRHPCSPVWNSLWQVTEMFFLLIQFGLLLCQSQSTIFIVWPT